jgi:hypothetical protein
VFIPSEHDSQAGPVTCQDVRGGHERSPTPTRGRPIGGDTSAGLLYLGIGGEGGAEREEGREERERRKTETRGGGRNGAAVQQCRTGPPVPAPPATEEHHGTEGEDLGAAGLRSTMPPHRRPRKRGPNRSQPSYPAGACPRALPKLLSSLLPIERATLRLGARCGAPNIPSDHGTKKPAPQGDTFTSS